jgi:hypothetical protein
MSLWDPIRKYASSQISGIGTTWGLPEWGISEAIAQEFSPTQQKMADWPQYEMHPSSPAPTGRVDGASITPTTSPPSPQPQPTSPPSPQPQQGGGDDFGSIYDQFYKGWGINEARADWEAKGKPGGSAYTGAPGPSPEQVRSEISSAYDPVFSELDRRLGLLPEQMEPLKKQVGELASYQTGEAGLAKERGLESLATEERGEVSRSAGTLRDLSANIRNLLEVAQNLYGGSSAVPAVATGIGKEATEARGGVLETRDEALRQIQSKATDVEKTFGQQLEKIDLWKSNQLMDITREFEARRDEIEGQKVGASQEKAQNLANLEMKIFTDAQQRLANLDQAVNQYKLNMQTWREQREGELQDYIAKLQATAKYTPSQYSYNLPDISGQQKTTTPPITYTGKQAGASEEDIWKNWLESKG